jgi:hypothetical protein
MRTFEVELRRTSYITLTVEAENEDDAEEKAWLELDEHAHADANWDVESIEEVL